MAIEAQGTGSLGSNPSNIGAVYLGQMPDLLKIQQEAIDDAQQFAQLKQQEKVQSAALQKQLYDSLSFKEAAVRPADAQYFPELTKQIHNKFSNTLAKYNGNVNAPGFMQEMAQIRGEKDALELQIQASAGAMKAYQDLIKDFDPQKDDPSILMEAQKALTQTPQEAWEKGGAQKWRFDKQPRKVPLGEFIDKYLGKKLEPKTVTTKVLPPDGKGIIKQKTQAINFTNDEARKYAEEMYSSQAGKDIVQDTWDMIDDEQKQAYLSQYPDMDETQAMIKAHKDYVTDLIILRQVIQDKEEYKGQEYGYKKGVEISTSKAKSAEKGRRFPELVSQVFLGDPNLMRKLPIPNVKTATGQPQEVYGTTVFNQIPLGTYKTKKTLTKDGKQVEQIVNITEYPIMVFVDEVTGKPHMITNKTDEQYRAGQLKSQFRKFDNPQEMLDLFATSKLPEFTSRFGSADNWRDYLESKNAYITSGVIDPRKVVEWDDEKERVKSQKMKGGMAYIPIGTKQPAAKPKVDLSKFDKTKK